MPVPWEVIDAIIAEFTVEFVSEHDHRFWGFATKEEIEFHERIAKEPPLRRGASQSGDAATTLCASDAKPSRGDDLFVVCLWRISYH